MKNMMTKHWYKTLRWIMQIKVNNTWCNLKTNRDWCVGIKEIVRGNKYEIFKESKKERGGIQCVMVYRNEVNINHKNNCIEWTCQTTLNINRKRKISFRFVFVCFLVNLLVENRENINKIVLTIALMYFNTIKKDYMLIHFSIKFYFPYTWRGGKVL